jgi:hypothetical protein
MFYLTLKDNLRVIIRLLIFTLITLASVPFWQTSLVTAQDITAENPKNLNNETQFPSLKGQEAIEHLQKTGEYDSLAEAIRATKGEYSNLPLENNAASAFTQSIKLDIWENDLNDGFGRSVSISGNTAVIGGSKDGLGAAFVFVRNNTVWIRQQVLLPSDTAPIMHFGYDVYIEGDTIAVSGNLKSIYIFTRTDNIWTEEAKLDANDGVPISGAAISGNRIISGAVGDNARSGSAYIFVKNGSVWTQEAKLTENDSHFGDEFGISVGISGDTAIVGAHFDYIGSVNGPGSAFIFVRNGSNWIQQAQLKPSDGTRGNRFGASVAIDGDTAIVGAIGQDFNPLGGAYIYVRNGTTWTEQVKLARSDAEPNEEFGSDVDIDGDTVIVGAMRDKVGVNSLQGSAYVFSRIGNVWTEQSKLVADDGRTYELLGYSVAISGGVAIAGQATFRFENKRGAAYIFTKTVAPIDLQAASDTGTSDADNITNSRNLSFNIADVTAGATVQLFRDDQFVATTTAAGNTVTLTDVSAPANGTFRYTALQVVNNALVSQTVPLEVTIDTTEPAVTITKATNQPNPTNSQSINFVAAFNEPVVGFDNADVSFAGSTANVSNVNVTVVGEGAIYQVVVSGVTSDGQILQTKVMAGAVKDVAGNLNSASTNTDNTVTVDNVNPTVTINQGVNQADPTNSQPINFTVVFSEQVLGFTGSDISLIGSTANTGGAIIVITGNGTIFNVSIRNVTSSGQVQARINSQTVQDRVGNPNFASTSTDNTVIVQIPASAEISGRVLRGGWRGTYNVRLVLTASNGQEYYAAINPFGYYRFVNIPTGDTTIRVINKRGGALVHNFFLTNDTPNLNF